MIKEFLKKYGYLYIPGLIFLALNSYIQSLAPDALGKAIDLLAAPSLSRDAVLRQAGIIALIGVGIFAARFIWRLFIIGNARRMEIFLREKLYLKLQAMPVNYLQSHNSGDLMAYAINDVGAVRITFGPVLAQSVNGIVIALLSIFGMARETDLGVTLLALAPVPFAAAATIILGGKVQQRFGKVQKLFSGLSGFVNESIAGIKVTKAFAKEDVREAEFGEISGKMRDANVSLVNASSLISPAVTVSFGLSYALALIFGGGAVEAGKMGVGSLVSFLGYLTLVQQPIVQLGTIINRVQRGLASYKRLKAVFDEPSVPAFDRVLNESVARGLVPSVEVENVVAAYEDPKLDEDGFTLTENTGNNDHPALNGVSMSVPAGGSLGIAGATGSGKTTLFQLIMKLRPTLSGTIKIGGVDINDLPAATLRSVTGYVPQDGFLFSATIAENIALGKEVDTDRVKECARLACIADECEAFPDGYETQVGEGGTHLSGGQKQRVALARALYGAPKLLLLDDTLSAVDSRTEGRLNANLFDSPELQNVTKIVISHRLSSLERCDKIVVFDNGRIAESGTHAELLALNGLYAAAWKKQEETAGGENER